MLWMPSVVLEEEKNLCMSSPSSCVSLSVPPTHFCICDYLVKVISCLVITAYDHLKCTAHQVTHLSIKRLFARLRLMEQ